jgi:hypothetical protein
VALALTELYQVPVPRRELAALARRAENVFAGVPTGIMDQIAALLGQAGHALLLDCRAGTAEPVPFDPAAAGLTLLVIDTRVRHALGDGRYAERRRACAEGASALGVRSLRDVTEDGELARLSDPSLRRIYEGRASFQRRRRLEVGWEDAESVESPGQRGDYAEVPLVGGEDLIGVVTFGQDGVHRIGQTDLQVLVPGDQPPGRAQVVNVQIGYLVCAAGQIVDHVEFPGSSHLVQDHVIDLRYHHR